MANEQEWDDAPVALVSADELPQYSENSENLAIRPSRPGRPQVIQVPAQIPEKQQESAPVVPIVAPLVQAPEAPSPATPLTKPVLAPGASQSGVHVTAPLIQKLDLYSLLIELVGSKGSDLHLSKGFAPSIRVNGEMIPSPSGVGIILTEEMLKEALYSILTPLQIQEYEDKWELDCSHTIANVSRFRVNIMKQKGSIGAVFRVISEKIKTLEDLGMPATLYSLAALPRGLVLVTGQTGSGKSTTLASLIDHANRTRAGHIISIEDPIEFVHSSKRSVVNQREVGVDTRSFAEALKHVLRQDPDIILIGELRDLETIQIALSAAETGHLVFATLHTQSAKDTINRIIDVFDGTQQSQIRTQLASTLKAVICQTLIKRADGSGRVPALEIMLVNFPIASLIRNNSLQEIPSAVSTGAAEGMQTLDQHLAELVIKGTITREAAEEVASDMKTLDAYIGNKRISGGTDGASAREIGLSGSSM